MEKIITSKIRLNLGCGKDYRQGWINIDALADVHPDVVHDLRDTLPFVDASISRVLCQDILEHFTKEEIPKVIQEIARVLKPGGVLEVRVPNIDAIIEKFSDDPEVRNEFLYGTTKHTGVFGAHKVGFTPLLLTKVMLKHGLELTEMREVETNYVVFFKKNLNVVNSLKIQRIVFINQTLGMGGAETFNADLLQGLQKQGVEIESYTNFEPFQKQLISQGISTKRIPIVIDVIGNWKGIAKAIFLFPLAFIFYGKLAWNLRRKTDLVLLTGFSEKLLFSPWAKLLNIPVVWVEFGPLKTVIQKFFHAPKIAYRMVKDFADRVIVPSEHTQKDLLEQARFSLHKMEVIPCGRNIDLQKYQGESVFSNATVVCVSRLEKGKGQDLLIQAFAKIKSLKKNNVIIKKLKLLIIGEGDFENELTDLIHQLHLEDSVELLGKVDDALEYLHKSSLCVFPSVWDLEGFGMVTIEAMALGKPIVAFNRGPTNEIITSGKNGLLATNKSIDDLAEKMIMLLEDPELSKKLGRQAKKDFREKYTLAKVVEEYLRVLSDARATTVARKLLKKVRARQL